MMKSKSKQSDFPAHPNPDLGSGLSVPQCAHAAVGTAARGCRYYSRMGHVRLVEEVHPALPEGKAGRTCCKENPEGKRGLCQPGEEAPGPSARLVCRKVKMTTSQKALASLGSRRLREMPGL